MVPTGRKWATCLPRVWCSQPPNVMQRNTGWGRMRAHSCADKSHAPTPLSCVSRCKTKEMRHDGQASTLGRDATFGTVWRDELRSEIAWTNNTIRTKGRIFQRNKIFKFSEGKLRELIPRLILFPLYILFFDLNRVTNNWKFYDLWNRWSVFGFWKIIREVLKL